MLKERCGLILESGLLEIENIAPDPYNFFAMPESVMHHSGIIGTWHTHPNTDPNLSVDDYRFFTNYPELNHFVIGNHETWRYYVQDGTLLVSHYEDHLLTRLS